MLKFGETTGADRIVRPIARDAKQAGKELDLAMKHMPRACVTGCSHCCYQIVEVHSWEAEEISRYVIENMNKEAKALVTVQLQSWHNWFDNVARPSTTAYPLTFQEVRALGIQVAAERIPCPYLIDSKCSIYPVRPAVCRMHLVKENPEKCKEDPLRNGDTNRFPLFEKYASPARFDLAKREFFFRPLPYLMIEGLNVTVQSRPMLGWGWDSASISKR